MQQRAVLWKSEVPLCVGTRPSPLIIACLKAEPQGSKTTACQCPDLLLRAQQKNKGLDIDA